MEGRNEKYPFLSSCNISFRRSVINGILQDIVNLNDELVRNGEEGVMMVKNHNGSNSTLLKVSIFSSYYRFDRNFKEAHVMKTMLKELNTEQSYEQRIPINVND